MARAVVGLLVRGIFTVMSEAVVRTLVRIRIQVGRAVNDYVGRTLVSSAGDGYHCHCKYL